MKQEMKSEAEAVVEKMGGLRRTCASAADGLDDSCRESVERYRTAVREGVRDFAAVLCNHLRETSDGDPRCAHLGSKISEYLEWLQWTFWDLPYYALCMRLPDDRVRQAVRTCGMVYLSLRIIDDVVDRHFVYKGRHATLMSSFGTQTEGWQRVEGSTILAGLLVCFGGLAEIAASSDAQALPMLVRTLEHLRGTTVGAVMEMSSREHWTDAYYERMTLLKNVEYWRVLYTGIDPEHAAPLYPFLQRYYALAQMLNDVKDFTDDERHGQPNLVSMLLRRNGNVSENASSHRAAPLAVEIRIANEFLDLDKLAGNLPDELHRNVARLKIAESLEEAFGLGLFKNAVEVRPSGLETEPNPLHLQWYSSLEEIVQRRGVGALIEADCAVCHSRDRKRLFEKQGFGYFRCLACGHVYVSPRVDPEITRQMSRELDSADFESGLMSVQRLFAAPICHLLKTRAPGPRLLDIGFGQGWILRLARSYGFEPYGMESSVLQIENLASQLGNHLHLVQSGESEFPAGFDAVVVSHVLEHLEAPDEFLGQVFRAMNPDGVLYVAVPDIDSLQFRLFGKRWDVIAPLSHLQYFQQSTLSRLLQDCLFKDLERVNHPPIPDPVAPRWMRLIRKLGGTDAGELAMICRRPAM
jgi:2-polyprenyl-3-methyl-5-hydroxy-6-metoxy-1,4-benzoquinol methylase